ncbi:hypothetical protein [Haloarcula sp. 1CSR25-25]|uniref:hypothetical protein n=1 Tax=Haloarcula sp. 1CSR25-25 TaxID=2862545 RepID=UPI0028952DAE|nr:hypothetical protein [Haloarcula sp. 1CSR25-25]MDT3434677.1 hypothetical protein [Haloarcula sp. 1CSR25-25]
MPIHINDLKAQAEEGISVTPGTQKAEVLRVLVTHPEMAFTPKDIATHADIPADNAPTVCKRLAEKELANTENGYYYLPQDDATAAAVRRALGSAHQQDMAQKTAEADEAAFADDTADTESERLTDAEVDAELAEMETELRDI